MLRNHIIIAWRNLLKHPMFSIINILGLAIGITCSCLLYLFIHDELSQDGFHEKADRIYRVLEVDFSNEQTRLIGQTAPPVAKALEQDYPEVMATTRLFQPIGHIDTERNGERIHERNYYLAESNFFEIFDFKFKQGDPATAFYSPNSLVITENIAKKYFGAQNPIGEVFEFQNYNDAIVTGVIENIPGNSHLQFDFLMNGNPSDSIFISYLQNWSAYGAYTYLVVNHRDQMTSLQQKSKDFTARYWPDQPNRSDLQFQNIKDIYFNSASIEYGTEVVKGEIRYVYLFSAIGLFLLLIACINYINLATAKSSQRAKEIGIRKVSGAIRWQLITQFLIESMVVALIALVLSIGLLKTILPYFNQITGKLFLFNLDTFGDLTLILLAIATIIGLLSGLYPALYLSRLKPATIVKGEVRSSLANIFMRQGLVITQFTLSIIMIVATVVTSNQMNYIRNRNLGFNQETMAIVDINNGNVRSNFETMKYEFGQVPGVEKVAASSRVPGEWKDIVQLFVTSDQLMGDSLQTYFMSFDEHMIETYDMDLISGQNFSGNRLQDSTTVLINDQAADALGWDQPVGRELTISQVGTFKVIGVVEGFHYQSLHEAIAPLVIGPWSNAIQSVDYFSLKLSGKYLAETLSGIKSVHEQFDNTTAMELHFLDQQLQRFYQADERAQKLFTIGAGLTVFIACLGLFGLASFIIQKRTKEISIRKVLGATVTSLFFHLSKSFVQQIIVAFLIAMPIAWWAMYHWLSYFAYRVNMGISAFLWALGLSLLVGLLTIGHRAIKAAMVNPANSLKSD